MSEQRIYWSSEETARMQATAARGRERLADLRLDLEQDLHKFPDAEFCAWGGLNPHLANGSDYPVCRGCPRNEGCAKPYRLEGF